MVDKERHKGIRTIEGRLKMSSLRKCKSEYYDSSKHETVRCGRREGHTGDHHWFSFFWFLSSKCEYIWDDSVAIKGNEKCQ